jgi:hypothetical protein
MATKYVFIQGKAKWFKAQTPNKFGNWSHDIYLNDASLKQIQELKETKGETEGIKNILKKDDDGYFMTFNRPQQKMVRGKVVGFAAPEVLDKENKRMYDVLVGNGSDITSKLEYYTYNKPAGAGKGSAVRWASTRVDNLIPFETQRDFTEEQQAAVRGLEQQPPQPEF